MTKIILILSLALLISGCATSGIDPNISIKDGGVNLSGIREAKELVINNGMAELR